MELLRETYEFGRNKNATMHKEITLNLNFDSIEHPISYPFEDNELVYLKSKHQSTLCMITHKSIASNKRVFFSNVLQDLHPDLEALRIEKIPKVMIHQYVTAKTEHLKSDKIGVSSYLMDQLSKEGHLLGIRIVNCLNGHVLTVKMSGLHQHEGSQPKLWLGVKQRRLLDIELPTFVSSVFLEKHPDLKSLYPSEDCNLNADNYYEDSKIFKTICTENHIPTLAVYPVYRSVKRGSWIKRLTNKGLCEVKRLLEKALAFIIGQHQLTLKVIRPYPTDESDNSVRISHTSMKLLGLEETDTIVIQSDERSIKARILPFDDWNAVSTENRIKSEQDLTLMIGIPSYMRKDLDLLFIHSNVTIKRDLTYFFRKNLYRQVMTILGLLLAMPGIRGWSPVYQIIGFTALTLLLVYISFSEIREKISNR